MNVRPGTIGYVTGEATRQRVFPQAFVCLEGAGVFRGGRVERMKRAAGVAGKGRGRLSGEGQNLRGNKSFMRGQAMILTLAALFFLVLMTLATYNLAQITHSKAQTLNAADAGAYAAAAVTARHANFMAYTNRAMIANHVFVGQVVSLISFAKMLEKTGEELETPADDMKSSCQQLQSYNPWQPIGMYCYGVWLAIGNARTLLKNYAGQIPNMVSNMIGAANATIKVLSGAQFAARGTLWIDVEKAVDAVVEANDPDLEVNDALAAIAVGKFMLGEDRDDDKKRRFRKLISNDDKNNRGERRADSLDKFTRDRAWTLVRFPFIAVMAWGDNTGGTALGDDNKTWLALDGGYLYWTKRPICVPIANTSLYACGPLIAPPKYPLAAQGAIAGNDDAEDELQKRIPIASGYRSDAYDNRGSKVGEYDGLQPYYDRKNIGKDHDTSWPIMVKVATKSSKFDKGGSTPDANRTFGTGNTAKADGMGYDLKKTPKIESLGSAEVYFRQPSPREVSGDNSGNYKDNTAGALVHTEYDRHRNGVYASYFSPYWQARLVDPVEKITDKMGELTNLLK